MSSDSRKEISLEQLGLTILNIPDELQKEMLWAGSTYKLLDPSTGRRDKSPRNVHTGERISVTSPEGWVTFEEAVNSGYPYIGMRLTADDPYTVIDLDKPTSREQADRIIKIIEFFPDTYTERSASGNGAHIVLRGPSGAGRRKSGVEIYSQERYIICTGNFFVSEKMNIYRKSRTIESGGAALEDLKKSLNEAVNPDTLPQIADQKQTEDDDTILRRMLGAQNGDVIKSLFTTVPDASDDWSLLDAKLAQHICFYTRNKEQALRLFRRSKLYRGNGEKSGYERVEKYESDYLLRQTFARAWFLEDQREAARLKAEDDKISRFVEKHRIEQKEEPSGQGALDTDTSDIGRLTVETFEEWADQEKLPPMSHLKGLLGQVQQYIYDIAPLPSHEIAMAGAIAFVSGIAGRHYNINGSGLTQYVILIAPTGAGKESASKGCKHILSSVAETLPRAYAFDGPSHIASGQGLLRSLAEEGVLPSKVLFMSEFGHTLKMITDTDATASDVKTRQVLLDMFSKSSWGSIINEMSYSDKSKNTAMIQSPNLCMFGDTTPDFFFETVKIENIKEGFLPRFTLIEHEGDRGNVQIKKMKPVPDDLRNLLISLMTQVLTMYDEHTMIEIDVADDGAMDLLTEFEVFVNAHINEKSHTAQLWNRAHLKALRLAGLFAVSDNIFLPKVSKENAELAIEFVLRDLLSYTKRMRKGLFGAGDSQRVSLVMQEAYNFFEGKMYIPKRLQHYYEYGVLPMEFIANNLEAHPAFEKSKKGAFQEVVNIMNHLVKRGRLIEVKTSTLFNLDTAFNVKGESAYTVGPHYYDAMVNMGFTPTHDVYTLMNEDKDEEGKK